VKLIALDLIAMLIHSLLLNLETTEEKHTLLIFFSAYGNMKIHMLLARQPYALLS